MQRLVKCPRYRVSSVLLRSYASSGAGENLNLSTDSKETKKLLELNPRVMRQCKCVPTAQSQEQRKFWMRVPERKLREPHSLQNNFEDVKATTFSERAALKEAARCLKCADAPCQKACPTQLDIRSFITSIANKNYYGAAKAIFSDNPLGITCGMVCPTADLCMSTCNLHATEEGPIKIGGLQQFATNIFRRMGVAQVRPPGADKLKNADKKVALLGGGPASLSCATYLGRLGYKDVTIYEKDEFYGGVVAGEIPQFRLPLDVVKFEVEMVKQLGIKFESKRELKCNDLTIKELLKDGNEAIFLGIGLPDPVGDKVFDGLNEKMGYFTSKSFLPKSAAGSKPGLCGNCKSKKSKKLPKLDGDVVVLGCGDTAFDCASSAVRCGAKRVYVAFMTGSSYIHAVPEEVELARHEQCEFIPYVVPKKIITENNKITAVQFLHTQQDKTGKVTPKSDETMCIKVDYVISAFGATLLEPSVKAALFPLELNKQNRIDINKKTLQTSCPNIFCGGDLAGIGGTVVEAVNDGKVAAWSIHCQLQGMPMDTPAKLPLFHTDIDKVDISIEVDGIKYLNPFGLASAPPTTSPAMCRRAFEEGWGFVVTKTAVLDKDEVTNVSPRIVRGTTSGYNYGTHQGSFMNIELISEKKADYWWCAISQLKKDFPKHRIIASIMCKHDEKDWTELSTAAEASGADALELNLSCPHGMGESGLGLATGQDPKIVEDIVKWVRAAVPKTPFYVKLTPNITDIVIIAMAAHRSKANGATVINTVSTLMGLRADGTPWPAIGEEKHTTYGGMSGSAVRPIALRAISAISKKLPDMIVVGTGGVESSETALQFIHAGASLVEISSAVQNQNYALISDYCSGLQALLYLKANPPPGDGKLWDGQSPPQPVHQKGKDIVPLKSDDGKALGYFGEDMCKRTKQMEKIRKECGPMYSEPSSKDEDSKSSDCKKSSKPAPKLINVRGSSLKYIDTFMNLDPKQQLVALINEDMCVNCGKCYMTCNDTGYQAITFDKKTHKPVVGDDCTGCTLCHSICPIIDCISMVPKKIPHVINRGSEKQTLT